MKAVLQRVAYARVRVAGEVVGEVGPGLLVLLGVMDGDGESNLAELVDRVTGYRVFPDDEGRMNRSLLDRRAAGEPAGVLVVSQFTLAADGPKGIRPSFDRAARPELAVPLYEAFCAALREQGLEVAQGRFGAEMEVELLNHGPATFLLER
ncbi:MAG: D-aminoacyl-tRNA deacylase [Planctomycetota bacterium]|jgi:D-tyrosyl-tRNA(Tyr) deacylase